MKNSIKLFETIEDMVIWRAKSSHECNLKYGGCYAEGMSQRLIDNGHEFREVEGSKGWYRISNFKLELSVAKKKVFEFHSAYDIKKHNSKFVMFGDNEVIAKVILK